MSVKPNFFIVGAPKCGTTAMYHYLKAHPQIFMPESVKEPHFFAPDLALPWYQTYADSLDNYLSLFAAAGQAQCIGEASVFYLYSPTAAQAIHDFEPAAKIIIMLRAPVDMLYSYYYQLVKAGNETLPDFKQALEAETERKQGRNIPPRSQARKLYYRDVARFSGQVERYFKVFGRDAVQVIIYDDFKADTGAVYRDTLAFLGVDSQFQVEFSRINENQTARSQEIQRLIQRPPRWYQAVRAAGRRLVPPATRRQVSDRIMALNLKNEPRPALDPALQRQLQQAFLPEVEALSELLGRDLTHWCR